MFGVRSWFTPMHSTSSLAFNIFFARFSPIGVAMVRFLLRPAVSGGRAERNPPPVAATEFTGSPGQPPPEPGERRGRSRRGGGFDDFAAERAEHARSRRSRFPDRDEHR